MQLLLPLCLLGLGACQKADTAPGPGGVTVGEARALDDAAQMIEDQRPSPNAVPAPPPSATASPAPPATGSAKPAG
ncbi:MAG: hypothetical protein JSR96_10495 [Proteobacteria bacterium]|nr:hypothetical protein [Pseudomonadota bacterium]